MIKKAGLSTIAIMLIILLGFLGVYLVKSSRQGSINETGKNYTINIEYPKTGSVFVDNDIKVLLASEIFHFKRALMDQKNNPADWKYDLVINYETFDSRSDIKSVKFEIYSFTGGAHGMTRIRTKVFDMKNSKILSLADIFRNDPDYLKKISSYVANQFKKAKISDDNWVMDGAGPTESNYSSFVITPLCIIFYFDPYQVACYAAGVQKVEMPLLNEPN